MTLSLQELFVKLQENKKKQKEIKKEYKDLLSDSSDGGKSYDDIMQEIAALREKQQAMKLRVQSQMGSRYTELEQLKQEVMEITETISDVAMRELMDGKTISITDQYGNNYEPVYKVGFKKAV